EFGALPRCPVPTPARPGSGSTGNRGPSGISAPSSGHPLDGAIIRGLRRTRQAAPHAASAVSSLKGLSSAGSAIACRGLPAVRRMARRGRRVEGERHLLGVLYAALGAFTFALNNVAMRRGVVTGSVLQGMAMTVAFGELGQLAAFPAVAIAWLAGQGVVHFVFGRYCNYKSNQLVGVNLSAPVVQLQVAVAMVLAVATLHEKFT